MVHIANLPDGNKLAYLDSGPVPNSNDFTTLVLAHGMHFNVYGFEHLLPLAHQHNFRLVLLQRKDYAGSSKYTDAEIVTLFENPHVFFQNVGQTLVRFVYYLIQNTPICEPSAECSKGGIGIVGWSLGATHTMSMFVGQNILDDSTYPIVMPYITTLVLYDPPRSDFGIPPLPETSPSPDTTVQFDDRAKEAFRSEVCSYYDQPPVQQWDGLLSSLDLRSHTDHSTFTPWTHAQQSRWTEDFPIRSDLPILTSLRVHTYLAELTTELFYSSEVKSRPFPLARVAYIWARRSTWNTIVPRYEIENKRTELLQRGLGSASLRPVFFKDVEWGNHFIHSDYPEEFMSMLDECVHQTC